jgi:hypothetical protein
MHMTATHDPKDTTHQISQPGQLQQESDRCLNYYSDQLPDIEPRLRRLTVRWGVHALVQKKNVGSIFLLGAALGMIVRRRYLLASCYAAGLVLQQLLQRSGRPDQRPGRAELALERYALKAQRGDYGKLEVIAFR